MAEIWKPIPSLPGYMASSDGRVLMPPRYAPLPHGGYRIYSPQPTPGKVGRAAAGAAHSRLELGTQDHGTLRVHRLVCEAFHGPAPFAGAVVIHIDEDGHNNKPENLKWGTQKENLNAPGFLDYCRTRTGENSPRAKWMAGR